MKFLPFLIAAGFVTVLSAAPVRPVVVTGHSMSPTLRDHQLVLGSRKVDNLKRGDVVVVDTPEGPSVKRIAFIEGDVITQYCWWGTWTTPKTPKMLETMEDRKVPRREVRVPAGSIFVMGDNRDFSIDSRNYGVLPASSVRLRIESAPDFGIVVPGAKYVGRAWSVRTA